MKPSSKSRRARKRLATQHVRVPVLTEEYAVHVYVGAPAAVVQAAERRLRGEGFRYHLEGELERGIAWNTLPDHNPIIAVNANLPPQDALATLAHEASHAMGYIVSQTRLDDSNGEFRAHGISAVVRIAGRLILKKKRKLA